MEAETKHTSKAGAWTYTEIFVYDGGRVLKPTHVCGDELTFHDAPHLVSAEIRVCIKNGDRQTSQTARVLPHDPRATHIPIQLIQADQKAPDKLSA